MPTNAATCHLGVAKAGGKAYSPSARKELRGKLVPAAAAQQQRRSGRGRAQSPTHPRISDSVIGSSGHGFFQGPIGLGA
jgi:hypothetical protein